MWQATVDQQLNSDCQSFESSIAQIYEEWQKATDDLLRQEHIWQDELEVEEWNWSEYPDEIAFWLEPTYWPHPPMEIRMARRERIRMLNARYRRPPKPATSTASAVDPGIMSALLAPPFANLHEPLRSHFSTLYLAQAKQEQRSLCSTAAQSAVDAVTAANDRAVTAERELRDAEGIMKTLRSQLADLRVKAARAAAAAAEAAAAAPAAAPKPLFCKCHAQVAAVDSSGNRVVGVCGGRYTRAGQQRPCGPKCSCSYSCSPAKNEAGLDILCANAHTVSATAAAAAAAAAQVDEQ